MPYVTGNLAPVDAQAETTVSPVVLFSDVELSATPTAPSLIVIDLTINFVAATSTSIDFPINFRVLRHR
jgi:hypothetical protein